MDGWLFGFYGASTVIGYLTPNSVYMYINEFEIKYPTKVDMP